MSAHLLAQNARTQLGALAAAAKTDPNSWMSARPSTLGAEAADPGARSAAVLILFGELDGIPSAHTAQAPAVTRELDVLLLARATTLRSHPGQIAFPGGRIDPEDDGPIEAALREAQEETGLDPAGVEILGALPPVPLSVSQHLVTPVLAWWQRPSSVRAVDAAESAAVFRAPVADLLDPANRGVTVMQRDGHEWRGPGFHVRHSGSEHLVWGFTALLLNGLFRQMDWEEEWNHERQLPFPRRP